jgi:shikimate dehydrogenase
VCPEIPYQYFTSNHIAFDLIYNPAETLFLKKAKQQGAIIKNGLEMLVFQAEKAWKIWGF